MLSFILFLAVLNGRAWTSPNVELYDMFEVELYGPRASSKLNPFDDISLTASFRSGSKTIQVRGFYDGENSYKIRFMPNVLGGWTYTTSSNNPELDKVSGTLNCVRTTNDKNHGMATVDPKNPKIFRYSDGTLYFPIGTTSYAWTQENETIHQHTIDTLTNVMGPGQRGFNKLRTLVFPKWYQFTRTEPMLYAYEGTPPKKWDFRRFNVVYFQMLDRLIMAMGDIGVMMEMILFHPYDGGHWGFDCMGGRNAQSYNTSNDEHYLKYFVSRVSSFRHIWWSMANEFDFVQCKSEGIPNSFPIWDKLFKRLVTEDPYGHEVSIHNGKYLYNHSEPWITHMSFQGRYQPAPNWWQHFGVVKPVTWDEFQYEGNVPDGWGDLSAQTEVDRFWWMVSYGGFACGHSECFLEKGVDDGDQIMWWNHGNIFRGETPKRIPFFHDYMMNETRHPLFDELKSDARLQFWECLYKKPDYYLFHFEARPNGSTFKYDLPSGFKYEMSVIDTFGMTIKLVKRDVQNVFEWTTVANQTGVVELLRQ